MLAHRYRTQNRRGLSLIEILVVLAILFVFLMFALMTLPRQRENARLAGCRRNLMQIGVGLGLYERLEGYVPTVPGLEPTQKSSGQSPLQSLLETLSIPDLTHLTDISTPPKPDPMAIPGEQFVRGFVCPTDPYGSMDSKVAAISYRATAGDRMTGLTGAFAPGRRIKLSEIEEADGTSFTAGFSERLIGNNKPDSAIVNYAKTPTPLPSAGCPTPQASQWRGDAGTSWRETGWRSTLYNHALPPNTALSCIADDELSAFMGASSGHTAGVNVLMLDGSVRTLTSSVEPRIWQGMATTSGATSP